MSEVAIRVENLSKSYEIGSFKSQYHTLRDVLVDCLKSGFRRNGSTSGNNSSFWALNNLSFDVKRGEVVGIIGPNGAGKSTLLKILSRITEPSAGFAEIHGRVGSLLEVGTGFHGELTGRENIYLNGAIMGMKKAEIERKFDEIVDFSGVEKFIDTPVKRYSSGMHVRLAFAVAAHFDPDILIVDEVLAVGDAEFQQKCLGRMGSVAKEGRTVIAVSHNLGTIKSLCQRGLLLRNGTLQMDGPCGDVVAQYFAQHEERLAAGPQPRIEADLKWRDTGDGQGFFLYPKDQKASLSVDCGQPLILEFDIEAPEHISETSIGITILSGTGDKVVSMSSKVQMVRCRQGMSRVWRVRCDMGSIPLNAGVYFAQIYIGNMTSDYARFSQALSIKVREHDVFGWGNPLPGAEAWGAFYWAPDWDIRPVE